MSKVTLILHGWPQSDLSEHPLYLHLIKSGYEVLVIDLFNSEIVLTPENVVGKVGFLLKNRNLDAIFGISIGGLLLPHVARRYPQAKLVFIASGSYFRPNVVLFRSAIDLLQRKKLFTIASFVLHLPNWLIEFIYQKLNPYQGDEQERIEYLKDMIKNIRLIKGIPNQKEWDIVRFVSRVDNTEILKTLKNESLIINGKHDLLMPQEAGELLHKYLVNSKLIITEGEYFNVFGEKNLKQVDEFLKN